MFPIPFDCLVLDRDTNEFTNEIKLKSIAKKMLKSAYYQNISMKIKMFMFVHTNLIQIEHSLPTYLKIIVLRYQESLRDSRQTVQ